MRKTKWIICADCDGHGTVENSAFSNGFTSSEWEALEEDFKQSYMNREYDITCGRCSGTGKLEIPNLAAMNFGEKRQLVLERREARAADRLDREMAAITHAERLLGC